MRSIGTRISPRLLAGPRPQAWPRISSTVTARRLAAGAKARDAVNLSQVFLMYASDHQGRFPSNFDQVATSLRKEKMPLSGTNQFDIVYRGLLDDLKGIPGGAVALIRERQTWIAPSGKSARIYGLANGSSQIVESDDDFKAWEAEHLISSATGEQ